MSKELQMKFRLCPMIISASLTWFSAIGSDKSSEFLRLENITTEPTQKDIYNIYLKYAK